MRVTGPPAFAIRDSAPPHAFLSRQNPFVADSAKMALSWAAWFRVQLQHPVWQGRTLWFQHRNHAPSFDCPTTLCGHTSISSRINGGSIADVSLVCAAVLLMHASQFVSQRQSKELAPQHLA